MGELRPATWSHRVCRCCRRVGLRLRCGDGAAAKRRAVLGVLLVDRDRAVSAELLLEEMWGDQQPRGGVKALRCHISKLRDFLEPDRRTGATEECHQAGGICSRLSPTKSMPGASKGWQMRASGFLRRTGSSQRGIVLSRLLGCGAARSCVRYRSPQNPRGGAGLIHRIACALRSP
jgi:hypothetical protein